MINQFIFKAFLNFFVLVGINTYVINRNNSGLSLKLNSSSLNETFTNKSSSVRKKRQFTFTGGLAMGFGAYDYYNYYGDLVSDYSYDYYDWICSETSCQLCDILTSECCDPDVDVNCFLPDTCLNNPCLSGGTCISAKTVDDRPDFTCVCLPGLTGKYCQLVNDYFVGAERLALAMLNPTSVLGGLGGLGLSIPSGPGSPPIPPILAVLSEIQQRLAGSPPPPPPPPPSSASPTTDGVGNLTGIDSGDNQLNGKIPASKNNGLNGQPTQFYGSTGQMEVPSNGQYKQSYGYLANNPSYVQNDQKINHNNNNTPFLQYNQNHAYNGANKAFPNNQGSNKSNSGYKVLGAKRIPCPDGKIFNSEKEECMDFSLRKKPKDIYQS